MAKKNRKRKSKPNNKKPVPNLNKPWISQRSGFIAIGVLSVVLAIFMGWQLYPSEGLMSAIGYGVGFAIALWIVFGVSLAFNHFVRGKR